MTEEQKQKRFEEFNKELSELLKKYNAELECDIITDSSERYQCSYVEVAFDGNWKESHRITTF